MASGIIHARDNFFVWKQFQWNGAEIIVVWNVIWQKFNLEMSTIYNFLRKLFDKFRQLFIDEFFRKNIHETVFKRKAGICVVKIFKRVEYYDAFILLELDIFTVSLH